MHQYTANIANRMALVSHKVHLVTTAYLPCDRYVPNVAIHTPTTITDAGFSTEGLSSARPARVATRNLQPVTDMVHFTALHL